MKTDYTYRPLGGELYFEHKGVLYVNSNALDRQYATKKETFAWLSKSTEERIEASPYFEQIKKGIEAHPGCTLSEFIPR